MLLANESLMEQKFNTALLLCADSFCMYWLIIGTFLMQGWRPSFLKERVCRYALARICIHYRWFYRLL